MALKRFTYLERKLIRYPDLKAEYNAFIEEYQRVGHMSLSDSCCITPEITTTKLGVVFDASATSSTGLSLNVIKNSNKKFIWRKVSFPVNL
jgi:hypothetical protein